MEIKINGKPMMKNCCEATMHPQLVIGTTRKGMDSSTLTDDLLQHAPKLRRMAITWWITAGAMLVSAKKTMAATDDMSTAADMSNGIMNSFQDIVLTFGSVAIVVGLILLVAKKKWGVKTLKMTGFITAGVFLAPTAILLVAIVAMLVNDHLYTTFQQIRAHHAH